jgi:hypothetical protein
MVNKHFAKSIQEKIDGGWMELFTAKEDRIVLSASAATINSYH